jgi:hypothetical protein
MESRFKGNGKREFQRMTTEKILSDLDKQGVLGLARKSLSDEVVVEAVRRTGLPSSYIDAPGGTGGLPPIGNDPETQRVFRALEEEAEVNEQTDAMASSDPGIGAQPEVASGG